MPLYVHRAICVSLLLGKTRVYSSSTRDSTSTILYYLPLINILFIATINIPRAVPNNRYRPQRAGQVQWHVLLSRRTFKYSRLIELERREKEFFILFISLDIAVAHGRRDKIFIQKMEDGDKVLFVIGC